STGEDILVSNNILGKSSVSKSCLAIRDMADTLNVCAGVEPASRAFCGRMTKHFLIQDNEFLVETGASAVELGKSNSDQGDAPGTHDMEEQDAIVERNYIHSSTGGVMGLYLDRTDNPRLVVRNNVIDISNFTDRIGIKVATTSSYSDEILIYNNTCYSSDTTGSYIKCIRPNSGAPAIIRNNVLYAPNATGDAIYVRDDIINPNITYNYDNSADGGITSNPFTDSSPPDAAEFTPDDAQLLGQGTQTFPDAWVHVFDDFLGNARGATPDIGAIED
ncbi:unnamed protein product, partial [marine sediment metagenome]